VRFLVGGDFFKNEALLSAIENCKAKNSALHMFGLLSDGGVHSHNTHMYGLLELAKRAGLEKVYLHCFLDGRDTPPKSGRDFVAAAVDKMKEIGVGKVATVMGRYYAMDRDNRWDRVELAYKAMVYGEGKTGTDPVLAVENSYGADVTDEFVVPTVIERDGKPVATVKNDDSVIFYNFRPDRAREISMDIYGSKMGKDIQDIIISLEQNNSANIVHVGMSIFIGSLLYFILSLCSLVLTFRKILCLSLDSEKEKRKTN